jgi:hypothetical protein
LVGRHPQNERHRFFGREIPEELAPPFAFWLIQHTGGEVERERSQRAIGRTDIETVQGFRDVNGMCPVESLGPPAVMDRLALSDSGGPRHDVRSGR